jgi:hypothetical protein
VVIDVRPDDLVDPEAAEVFEAAASACREAGWQFRRTGAPPAVLTANVRWLAGYRNPRCHRPEIADAPMERFVAPMPLFTGAAAVGDRLVVLPVLYHLLWRQVLSVDLAAAPLSPGSLVHLAEAARSGGKPPSRCCGSVTGSASTDHWRVLPPSRRSGLISFLVLDRTPRVSRVQSAGVAPSHL